MAKDKAAIAEPPELEAPIAKPVKKQPPLEAEPSPPRQPNLAMRIASLEEEVKTLRTDLGRLVGIMAQQWGEPIGAKMRAVVIR